MTRTTRVIVAAASLLLMAEAARAEAPAIPAIWFPPQVAIELLGPSAKHEETSYAFPSPMQLADYRLTVTIRVPPFQFVRRPFSAIQLWAKDGEWRWQNTSWTDGMISDENPHFDVTTGIMTLTYQPTAADIDRQGWTQYGFDPATGIREVGLKISTPRAAGLDYRLAGNVEVLEVVCTRAPAPPRERAIMRPLLRTDVRVPDGPPSPVDPAAMKHGVSRYIVYGDLHRWPEIRDRVPALFRAQAHAGLTAFRLMGGLDTRPFTGGIRMGDAELEAMEALLNAARAAGQKHQMFTLFDGAVSNITLRRAIQDPGTRKKLFNAYRPFIKRFGRATIDHEPVVFDLVNEIHSVGGVLERERQRFVEALIDLFIKEAPGASLTLGVADWRDLAYWTYLSEQYADQPVRLIYTFHWYDDLADAPAVWEMSLPDGAEVGVTEADGRWNVESQIRLAASKGYRWLLFWQDQEHPYDPAAHRQALDAVAAR